MKYIVFFNILIIYFFANFNFYINFKIGVFMKVCVYAICKNEEKFVTRWIDSMKEADQIVVLDTGSTDKTISLLEQNGVIVFKKNIKPWRFDTASNICLSYLDKDVDINELSMPLNEIWYTSNEKIQPYKNETSAFAANIVSNKWLPSYKRGIIRESSYGRSRIESKGDLISQASYDTIYLERYSESNSECPQCSDKKKHPKLWSVEDAYFF